MPRGWLKALLTPWSRRAALVAFAGTFLFPVGGLGVDLCPLHAATGLPCPGCGVTRGLSALSQGDWHFAVGANPFVLMLWPFLALLGALAFVPQARVDRLERGLDALEPFFSRAFRVVLAAFFGFGLLRLGWVLISREWFP
ncbi:MAG: DUF2752 domain-containing protein [Myxococcaceae bacterium]|nr:DUF2752 domain-containing protein [Myxococcaceae bacterium]